MAVKQQEDLDETTFQDDFSRILGDLGAAKQLRVTSHRRNPITKKMEYARSSVYDVGDDDLIEDLYEFYPDGGEFRLAISDANNKSKSQSLFITLAKREPKVIATVKSGTQSPQAVAPAAGNTDFMLAMMQMNQKSSETTMQMITSVLTAMISSGNKNSSDPAAMLDSAINAFNVLKPQDNSNDFDKMLDRVSKMRDLTEVREAPAGVTGIISQFAPLLATLAAQQPVPQLPAPQTFSRAPTMALPVQKPAPNPQAQPIQQPQVTQDQETMLKKLSEIISVAKFYIDRDFPSVTTEDDIDDIAMDICDYLVMQRSIGVLSDAEISMALSLKSNLAMILQSMQDRKQKIIAKSGKEENSQSPKSLLIY